MSISSMKALTSGAKTIYYGVEWGSRARMGHKLPERYSCLPAHMMESTQILTDVLVARGRFEYGVLLNWCGVTDGCHDVEQLHMPPLLLYALHAEC